MSARFPLCSVPCNEAGIASVQYRQRTNGVACDGEWRDEKVTRQRRGFGDVSFMEPGMLLVNAITHGWPDARKHQIDLSVAVEPARVVLAFEDDGVEFDPRLAQRSVAAAPTAPVTIDNAPTGGRGLLLVRKAARSIDYLRAGGRNRLTIGVARG